MARALDFCTPPISATIGHLVAGVIKTPPPSLWDHSEAIWGIREAGEGRPRCILDFVVHLHSCSQRVGPRDPKNYNSQHPGRQQKEGGLCHVALWLGGLFLSAAVAARGTGAFCLEQLRGGPPERRGRRPSPAPSVPAAPRWGGGAAPQAGPHLRRCRPALGPPRPPSLKGGTRQAFALPSHLRSRHHFPPCTEPEAAQCP